jgi:AraC-like DNA-binding protein
VLASEDLEVGSLFAAAGIDPAVLDAPARLATEKISRLWELAVERSGNPAIGLAQHHVPRPASFDVVGYTMMSCADLRGAFERLIRYLLILSDALTMTMSEEPTGYRVTFELFGGNRPRADMTAPLPTSNPLLADLHERFVGEYLKHFDHGQTSYRAREVIIRRLPDGEPRRDQVASELRMSERTLQRRLEEEATSFTNCWTAHAGSSPNSISAGYIYRSHRRPICSASPTSAVSFALASAGSPSRLGSTEANFSGSRRNVPAAFNAFPGENLSTTRLFLRVSRHFVERRR